MSSSLTVLSECMVTTIVRALQIPTFAKQMPIAKLVILDFLCRKLKAIAIFDNNLSHNKGHI